MKPRSEQVLHIMHSLHAYKKEIIAGCVAIVVTVGAYIGYRAWRTQYNQAAHSVYVRAKAVFDAPVIVEGATPTADMFFRSSDQKWQAVIEAFEEAYAAYPRSGFAGVFLAYVAHAYQQRGMHAEAVEKLKSALSLIKDVALHGWYQGTLALLYLDSSDLQEQQRGLTLLEKMASDPMHSAYDFALYWLGDYYWANSDTEKAREYWNMLDLVSRSSTKPSSWFALAKKRLSLVQE